MPAIYATAANSDTMRPQQPYATSRRWAHFIPSGVMLLGITYLSIFKTTVPLPLQDVALLDKWGHMLAYAVWALCLLTDCTRTHVPAKHVYTLSAAITLIYGALMELVQYFFCPLRQGEWLDWLADAIGIGLALLLFAGVKAILSHKR